MLSFRARDPGSLTVTAANSPSRRGGTTPAQNSTCLPGQPEWHRAMMTSSHWELGIGMKRGRTANYHWFYSTTIDIDNILKEEPSLLLNKRVVISSFDSGPFKPTRAERHLGWRTIGNLAISPPVDSPTELPQAGFDEWHIFDQVPPNLRLEAFVNFTGFVPEHVEQLHTEERPSRFWDQILRTKPATYIADGGCLVLITRHADAVERLWKKFSITMDRRRAIETLARVEPGTLDPVRQRELLAQVRTECREDDPKWERLSIDLKREVRTAPLEAPSAQHAYPTDELLLPLSNRWARATTAHLFDTLQAAGHPVVAIGGNPVDPGVACPCCGRLTLNKRGEYDICSVCWWEDDGQDNEDAEAESGPNHLSLLMGRANFIRYGIFDPARSDLSHLQQPAHKYKLGRRFGLDSATNELFELSTNWRAKLPNAGDTQ